MSVEGAAKGNLDLLLLAVVRSTPSHGYTLIKELARRSRGTFNLAEGAVYPALHKLEEEGLITSRWEVAGGRRRRVYRITRSGRKALGERTREFERVSAGVRAVLESS